MDCCFKSNLSIDAFINLERAGPRPCTSVNVTDETSKFLVTSITASPPSSLRRIQCHLVCGTPSYQNHSFLEGKSGNGVTPGWKDQSICEADFSVLPHLTRSRHMFPDATQWGEYESANGLEPSHGNCEEKVKTVWKCRSGWRNSPNSGNRVCTSLLHSPLPFAYHCGAMKTRSLLVIASCLLLMVTSSLAADFISSLPLQGCQGVLVPLSTDKLMVQFNGTRMAFHALDAPNGSFDYASSLYFQWTDVRELLRGENGVKAETDTIVGLQELSDCVCNFAAINQVVDGILEEGVETTISSCKSNPTMVAKAFVTVSNETWWEPYGPTMDGSSLEYFNYTHPYVQAHNSHFSLPLLSAQPATASPHFYESSSCQNPPPALFHASHPLPGARTLLFHYPPWLHTPFGCNDLRLLRLTPARASANLEGSLARTCTALSPALLKTLPNLC